MFHTFWNKQMILSQNTTVYIYTCFFRRTGSALWPKHTKKKQAALQNKSPNDHKVSLLDQRTTRSILTL